ncbi:hypothetical protein ABQD64_05355 [Vagococcus fluvialis]|uniref:hypothetical protein n=1 Tax=Vagococcus fluvialis TaxID=2738 RepID=UPI0032E36EED
MTKLIKNKQQITCNNCNEFTPYIVKKKKLFGEFERMYAECEHCHYQKTIYYTNKKLRSLLKKQKNETHQPRKLILKEKIESEMKYLQDKLER